MYTPVEHDEQGGQTPSDGGARKNPSQTKEGHELHALYAEHDIDVEVHWFHKMLGKIYSSFHKPAIDYSTLRAFRPATLYKVAKKISGSILKS